MTRANSEPKLLTTSDISRFCEVDLGTVHDWLEKGTIPHFRSPGGHYRFRPIAVLEFLRKYRYPIPEELVALAIPAGERGAIVAYLRAQSAPQLADAIERGAHLEEPSGPRGGPC